MTLHHATPFAICVGEPNSSQQNVACLPLVMKDDMHQHQHQQQHEYERLAKIPITANGKSAWTDTATECLIDVFEEKWNSLRRGNLKARNWDEVGAELGIRCGVPKTGDQCRHKIEKLRGRFRQEKVISNFGQSKWPWYDRLNLMFGDRARQLKEAEFDSGHGVEKAAAAEVFKQDGEASQLQLQHQHHHSHPHHHQQQQHQQQEILQEQENNNNEKGDNDSYASQKRANSGERDEAGSPRSKSGRGSKRRREWSELGAAMKYFGETLMKIEECKMEVQRDNERLRIDLETKRAQLQDIELKRTEMLIQMELKRTEMLCDLELRRTKMQMDLFEALANKCNARSKKS